MTFPISYLIQNTYGKRNCANPNRTITGKFIIIPSFIAVGNGIFYKGVRSTPGDMAWSAIAYGNGRYVTINDRNYVSTSTDGINWTTPKQISLPNNSFNKISAFKDIAFGNGKFIIISGSDVYTAISTDGINWDVSSKIMISNESSASITFGRGKFVAAGYGWLFTSTDGINWTSISEMYTYDINDVSFINNQYVAVAGDKLGISSDGGQIMISSDGIKWNITQDGGKGVAWMNVLYGNGKYVIFEKDKSAKESTTGEKWNFLPKTPINVAAAIYQDGKYIIASTTRECYFSTDAKNWKQMPIYSEEHSIANFLIPHGSQK